MSLYLWAKQKKLCSRITNKKHRLCAYMLMICRLVVGGYMTSGQISHTIIIDSTIKPTVLYEINKRKTLGTVFHTLIFVMSNDLFRVAFSIKLLWNHCKPRPQVAYCWRNIDYLNISLWMKIMESHSAHFSSHSFLSLPLPIHSPSCVSSCKHAGISIHLVPKPRA